MLTLRDCLDYCDLLPEEVDLLAEHEHLPAIVAAELACSLTQSDDGVVRLSAVLHDSLYRAEHSGDPGRVSRIRAVVAHFDATHPSMQAANRVVAGPVKSSRPPTHSNKPAGTNRLVAGPAR